MLLFSLKANILVLITLICFFFFTLYGMEFQDYYDHFNIINLLCKVPRFFAVPLLFYFEIIIDSQEVQKKFQCTLHHIFHTGYLLLNYHTISRSGN